MLETKTYPCGCVAHGLAKRVPNFCGMHRTHETIATEEAQPYEHLALQGKDCETCGCRVCECNEGETFPPAVTAEFRADYMASLIARGLESPYLGPANVEMQEILNSHLTGQAEVIISQPVPEPEPVTAEYMASLILRCEELPYLGPDVTTELDAAPPAPEEPNAEGQ